MLLEQAVPRPTFKYKTEPYGHQHLVFEKTRDELSYALYLDMGCGKSKILLDTASWLYSSGAINGLLVLAPKGVYGNWVSEPDGQICTHVHEDTLKRSNILKWKSNHATKKFQKSLEDLLATSQDDFAIFVMNAEALASKAATRAAVDFLKSRRVLLAVDEATIIKTPTAQVTQKIIRLGRGAKYRRILTGTPVTNSPLDVYSQYEFLDPAILGHANFYSFRARYALLAKQQIGQRSILVINGYQRQDELRQRMEKACVIMKKEDCLDLPEKIYHTRDVELSTNQKRAYETMRRQSIAELESGETVTADIALTKLLRLHQITLGFLSYTDENGQLQEQELDPDGGPRAKALLELLEELGPDEKVIVWTNYTYNINALSKLLKKIYQGNGVNEEVVAVFNGQTAQEDRETIVKRFQDKKDPLRFFLGNSRVGGFGLTLTEAANTIYFSNNFSLEVRMQSEDRIHRIGQTRAVNYVDLRAPGTVDDKIVKALRSKKDLAEELTGGGWKRFLEPLDD